MSLVVVGRKDDAFGFVDSSSVSLQNRVLPRGNPEWRNVVWVRAQRGLKNVDTASGRTHIASMSAKRSAL